MAASFPLGVFRKEFIMSSFYGGLIPQFAGYGGVVPSISGSPFPGGTPNNMNGFSATVKGASAGGGITPWAAPSSYYQAFAPGGQQPSQGAVGTPGVTGGTGVATGGGAAGGGNYLSNLLAQTAANPGPQIPNLPDLGIRNQGQQNAMNYANYLQQQANADNNQRFNTAVQALQGQGTSAKSDIKFAQDEQNAQNTQDLTSRGLINSTIEPTLKMGTADMAQRANQRVDEGVAQQFVNLLQSKQVSGPTMAQMFAMMQQAVQAPNQQFSGFNGGGVHYGPPLGATITY